MRAYLFPSAVRNILISGLCRSIVIIIEIALLQHFPEIQNNFCSSWKVGIKFHEANHVLSHIQDNLTGLCMNNLLYRKCLFHLHRKTVTLSKLGGSKGNFSHQGSLVFFNEPYWFCCIFFFLPQLSVQHFPIIEIAHFNIAAPVCPSLICGNHSLAAILIPDMKLYNSCKSGSIALGCAFISKSAFIPPISAINRNLIFLTNKQMVGHIVGLILDFFPVIIAKWSQDIFSGFFSVDIGFIYT